MFCRNHWRQGKAQSGRSTCDPPPLQIAHDCAVAMVLAEGPVVNAGDDQGLRSQAGSPPNNPQQGVIAHRQHQSLGEARCRSAAECQPQMVDDAFQPCRPARPGRENNACSFCCSWPFAPPTIPGVSTNGSKASSSYDTLGLPQGAPVRVASRRGLRRVYLACAAARVVVQI
jgi:hypothetical protein